MFGLNRGVRESYFQRFPRLGVVGQRREAAPGGGVGAEFWAFLLFFFWFGLHFLFAGSRGT